MSENSIHVNKSAYKGDREKLRSDILKLWKEHGSTLNLTKMSSEININRSTISGYVQGLRGNYDYMLRVHNHILESVV